MARNEQLLKAIEEFQIDDPDSETPFSARLAQEMNWSPGYARRAIDEYLRFVYLAMVADHPVTPSKEVDHVWHLHLAYTRSYWDALCGQILGRRLHHDPTRGGALENDRYDAQYRRTLEAYEREFEGKPPKDVWPPPEQRFKRVRYQIVDRSVFWLLPRYHWTMALLGVFVAIPIWVVAIFIAPAKFMLGWGVAASLAAGMIGTYALIAFRAPFTRLSQAEIKLARKSDGGGCGGAGGCGGGGSGCGGGGGD